MRTFFKDNNKIIINSMDHSEALVGKAFLETLKDKDLHIEARNDINDEFDGFVISITDKEQLPDVPFKDNQPISITPQVIQNGANKLEISFNDSALKNYILCDYDKESIDNLIKFFEGMRLEDISFNASTGSLTATTKNITNCNYLLPAGSLVYYDIESKKTYENEDITITLNGEVLPEEVALKQKLTETIEYDNLDDSGTTHHITYKAEGQWDEEHEFDLTLKDDENEYYVCHQCNRPLTIPHEYELTKENFPHSGDKTYTCTNCGYEKFVEHEADYIYEACIPIPEDNANHNFIEKCKYCNQEDHKRITKEPHKKTTFIKHETAGDIWRCACDTEFQVTSETPTTDETNTEEGI